MLHFSEAEFQLFVRDLRLVRAISFSGYTILLWDFLITIQDEVQYIWPSKLSVVKIIFLSIRYINLVSMGIVNAQFAGWQIKSHSFCVGIKIFGILLGAFTVLAIHLLVVMKAWVLWGRRYKTPIVLMVLFILYLTSISAFLTYGIIAGSHEPSPIPNIFGTCIAAKPDWLWVVWIPSIALDTSVVVFTIVALKTHSIDRHSLLTQPLTRILLRDTMALFLVSIFCSVSNLVTWLLFPTQPLSNVTSTFGVCLLNVTGQHLVLNLRGVDSQSTHLSTRGVSEFVAMQMDAFVSESARTQNSVNSSQNGGPSWGTSNMESATK